MRLAQIKPDDQFTKATLRVLRFVTTACILLSAWSLSNAQTPDPNPLDRVLTELQAGRTEKAYAALDELIKQYPNNPDAYLLRGSLKMEADPSQALSDFTKVIELKPDAGAAYHQRAMLRLTNGDTAGALKDLDASILHNFKDDSIYYVRGQLRWQTGELNGALSDLDEAIKLNPNNPRQYLDRGGLLLRLEKPDRALADFNYLINWYETDPSARPVPKPADRNGAKSPPASVAKNDSQPFMIGIAQETVNEAPGDKKMAPIIANTYIERGWILSGRGDHVAALADSEKAIRIDTTNMMALFLRANEYEFKGNLSAALADMTQAVQIEPKNGAFLVERGVILLLMGRDKEAQADFDRLLQADQVYWRKRIDERTAAVRKTVHPK